MAISCRLQNSRGRALENPPFHSVELAAHYLRTRAAGVWNGLHCSINTYHEELLRGTQSVTYRQRFRLTEFHPAPPTVPRCVAELFLIATGRARNEKGRMDAPALQMLVARFLSELRRCGPVISTDLDARTIDVA